MNQTPATGSGDDGFTLLELLVGLVLLSLISILVAQSLRSGRLALAAVERQSTEAVVEAVQRHLRRSIGEARAMKLPEGRGDASLMIANASSLRLITSYAPAGQYGGLYETSLQPLSGAGGLSLVEARTLYRPAGRPGAAEPVRPQTNSTLLSGIASMKFSYLGIRDPQRGAEWLDEWTDAARLPQLISLDIAFPAGDLRRWPPLVMAPAAGE